MSVTAMSKPPETEEVEAKGGKKKKLIILVAVLALAAGAAYWFVLKPKPAEAKEEKPVAGEVMALDPIQINLAGGHYLRIGVALQLIEKVAHEPDGSQALDSVIEIYSGLPLDDLSTPEQRSKLKAKLEKELDHDYHGDVMGVYYTEFVTQ